MSTRALYTFSDEMGEFHVYKHCDGYPEGAREFISLAMEYAWPLPRFEADEFAAAFVAANKSYDGKPSHGGIRLMKSGHWKEISTSDIEFHYTVSLKNKQLHVQANSVHHDYATDVWSVVPIFEGTLDKFCNEFPCT